MRGQEEAREERKKNEVELNKTPDRKSILFRFAEGNPKSNLSDPHDESHSTRANDNSLNLFSVEDLKKHHELLRHEKSPVDSSSRDITTVGEFNSKKYC